MYAPPQSAMAPSTAPAMRSLTRRSSGVRMRMAATDRSTVAVKAICPRMHHSQRQLSSAKMSSTAAMTWGAAG